MSLSDEHKNIRGILFDKDGTLIDFNSIWIPLAFELTNRLLAESPLPEKRRRLQRETLLKKIGVEADGSMRPGSIYASGTEEDLAETLYFSARELGCELPDYASFLASIRGEVRTYMDAHRRFIRPVPGAAQTLSALLEQGLTLGISTSDNEENTILCLRETGLLSYFHYIGCPDVRLNPKPSGDILWDFGSKFALKPEEIAVVGDTAVDIAFARQNNAGLAIGVLNGAGENGELTEAADYILPTVAEILQDGRPVWESPDEMSTTQTLPAR